VIICFFLNFLLKNSKFFKQLIWVKYTFVPCSMSRDSKNVHFMFCHRIKCCSVFVLYSHIASVLLFFFTYICTNTTTIIFCICTVQPSAKPPIKYKYFKWVSKLLGMVLWGTPSFSTVNHKQWMPISYLFYCALIWRSHCARMPIFKLGSARTLFLNHY